MKKLLILTGLVILGLVIYKFAYPSHAEVGSDEVITGSIVVDFQDNMSGDRIRELGDKYGVEFVPESKYSAEDKLYVGKVANVEDEQRIIDELRNDSSEVEAVDKEIILSIPEKNLDARNEGIRNVGGSSENSFPNDALYEKQWGFKTIHLDKSWRQWKNDVIVAVLDTGFTRTKDHQDTKVLKGYNFVDDNENVNDGNGHGGHTASSIAENTNNSIGATGVAFNAILLPVKVLSDSGSGSIAGIAEGIRWAANNKANIISMSLGGRGTSSVIDKAMEYAHNKGVTIICAAGNDGAGQVSFPANNKYAIAVAAIGPSEKTTFYSNWGKEIAIAAPGGDPRVKDGGILQNTIINGVDDYYWMNGTSMSTPIVSGTVALIISQGIKNPDMVRRVLIESARAPKGVDTDSGNYRQHYGAGIVDADKAVELAKTIQDKPLISPSAKWLIVFGIVLTIILFFSWRKWEKDCG